MGNSESNSNARNFTTFEWTTIEPKRRNIPGTPSLCRVLPNNLEADCYDIAVLGTLEEQMQNLLRRRSLLRKTIPFLLDMRVKQKQMFECNMSQRLEVYTQKIICRLNEIDLTEKEALYILKEGLQQFVQLQRYSNTFFTVNTSMIGFNGNGQLKVWLHQNYGRSQIQQETLARTEYQMLISIVRCFESFGLRVQNYYSFSKFQQIISNLAKEFDPYQSSQLRRSIAQKARRTKKNQQLSNTEKDQVEAEERIPVRHTSKVEFWKPHPHQQQVVLKQNLNPFKKNACTKDISHIVDVHTIKQPHSLRLYRPVSALTQSKQSLRSISSSTAYSSVQFIHLNTSLDQPTLSNSSKQVRKGSPSYVSPSFAERSRPKQAGNSTIRQKISFKSRPNRMQISLHRVSEEMSRITERSNQEESSSYLNLSSVSRPRLASLSKNLGIELVESSTSDDYFTRLEL